MMPARVPFLSLALLLLVLALSATGCRRRDRVEWRPDPEKALDVYSSLSADTVYAGERIQARLLVAHPLGASVSFSEPGDADLLHVLHRRVSSTELDEDRALTRYEYTVTALDPGTYPVFRGTVSASEDTGESWSLDLEPARIQVRSVLTGAEQRADIREVRPFPSKGIPLLWILLAVVLVLAILTAVLIARARHRGPALPAPPPQEPAHVRALRRLETLRRRGWIEAGQAEPFYVELSDILRHYLEERFALRAPEQTTEEFILSASTDPQLNPGQRELVTAFMQQSDLVKFARHTPGPSAMHQALEAGERLIRETSVAIPAEGSPS